MVQLSLQEAMNRATAHLRAGRFAEAISLLQQILVIQPNHPGVLVSLGIALHAGGRKDQSLATFEQLTRLQPNWPDGWNNLGVVLRDLARPADAAAAFRRCLELQPDFPAALDNLGAVLQETDQLDEAIALHQRSLALRPDSAATHSNLAQAYKSSGRIDEAIASYRNAIQRAPDDPVLHHFLGLTLLYAGNYEQGLAEHEWRCRITRPARVCREFPQPRWDGGPLEGRTLLIHAEQGMGDTILFARYLPLVAERGGRIILQCQPELVRPMRESFEVEQVVSDSAPAPAFDVHCPMMSLPAVFHTTIATIPAPPRYLKPDAPRAAHWRSRLDPHSAGGQIKVGLAWAGKRSNTDDRRRSLELSMLAPLAQVPGVRLISLQKGPAARDLEHAPAGMSVIDWTAELGDFADTAAMIDSLDLVISVDTAVAHLAGAMGKPVWVLLSFVPDWRWMQARADSPWYPSARLFRQSKPGQWNEPIRQATQALNELRQGPIG